MSEGDGFDGRDIQPEFDGRGDVVPGFRFLRRSWMVLATAAVVLVVFVVVAAGCTSDGPTTVVVGSTPAPSGTLDCTNRKGVSLDMAVDAKGAPTAEAALGGLSDTTRSSGAPVDLPGGQLVATPDPTRPNHWLLAKGDRNVVDVELVQGPNGWLVTGVMACD
jgi:hypothetical protein